MLLLAFEFPSFRLVVSFISSIAHYFTMTSSPSKHYDGMSVNQETELDFMDTFPSQTIGLTAQATKRRDGYYMRLRTLSSPTSYGCKQVTQVSGTLADKRKLHCVSTKGILLALLV